ncbi:MULTISPECIES: hypothetical protein [Actinosynnema]|uniref:hypothetical protein n=1 Tax=Actinosynnema TaxID=40566 RepID=UPI0020A490E7|nr:hypothetical protein [Actinosynnema pretiosum]
MSGVVKLSGGHVGLVLELDQAEVERRAASGWSGVLDLGVLDALMNLPAGVPVSWADLTERERLAVRKVPEGVVEVAGDRVVRRAVAPLTVRLALVAARDWRSGLKRAGEFAPFCARGVVLSRVPDDVDELHLRCGVFGVGAYVASRGEADVLLEPRAYVRQRHTAAHWRFAEEVHARISASSTAWAQG